MSLQQVPAPCAAAIKMLLRLETGFAEIDHFRRNVYKRIFLFASFGAFIFILQLH